MEIIIIILGYVPVIIYYLMKGSRAMDFSLAGVNIFELIISIVIPIISVVISVFVATRNGNGRVVSAQKDLSKEHTEMEGNLSEQHTKMMGDLSKENAQLKAEIKSDICKTQSKIDVLDRIINNEIVRKDNLSPDQSKINSAVDIIKIGWDNILRENQELKEQVNRLYKENLELNEEKEQIQKELDKFRSAQKNKGVHL